MRRFYLMLIPCHAGKKGDFDRVLNRSFYDGCKGTQRRRKRTRVFFISCFALSMGCTECYILQDEQRETMNQRAFESFLSSFILSFSYRA